MGGDPLSQAWVWRLGETHPQQAVRGFSGQFLPAGLGNPALVALRRRGVLRLEELSPMGGDPLSQAWVWRLGETHPQQAVRGFSGQFLPAGLGNPALVALRRRGVWGLEELSPMGGEQLNLVWVWLLGPRGRDPTANWALTALLDLVGVAVSGRCELFQERGVSGLSPAASQAATALAGFVCAGVEG
ncbi:MAG: hypothetical protein KME26_32370 [Oscillatoria princeps RMCB-10]|nr:hypothetical protein [Oscillatoria princeps RMCB-10]